MSLLNHSSKELLMDVLTLSQEELHEYAKSFLGHYYENDYIFEHKGEGLYFTGDIPVLLVAHMDTVHLNQPKASTIFYDQEKEVMISTDGIGADCRAGVFNILATVAKGYKPHIMLTWEEERGGIGASKLCERWSNKNLDAEAILVQEKMSEVNFAIQYDRHGYSEAVYYYLDNQEFEDYISEFGYHTQIGSYTDICEICPTFGFAGVNVAAGYVSEHTKQELLLVDEMLRTQAKVIKILEDQTKAPKFFEYKERSYAKAYGYGGYGSGRYSSKDWWEWEELEEEEWKKKASEQFSSETANDLNHDCLSCDTELIENVTWCNTLDEYQADLCMECRVLYYQESAEVPTDFMLAHKNQ